MQYIYFILYLLSEMLVKFIKQKAKEKYLDGVSFNLKKMYIIFMLKYCKAGYIIGRFCNMH